jgi:transposase
MLWEEKSLSGNSSEVLECYFQNFRRIAMTATLGHSNQKETGWLYVALEMSWSTIKVGSTTGPATKARLKDIRARDLPALVQELERAKARLGLPADAPVRLCYEAGRDGFWLERWLTGQGHHVLVVDPGSVRVGRRRKQAKTDRLDAVLLLNHLLDHHAGQRNVWSVVRVPTLAQEERRQLHRELETLKGERTAHVNRIKSLLATLGLQLTTIDEAFPVWLSEQKLLEAPVAVPADYQQRLLREHQRWQLVNEQIKSLTREQRRRVAHGPADPGQDKIRKLMRLRGVGVKSASLFGWEIFNWRRFSNRRQLGSMAGLTPTPYQSGDVDREMGLNKAGNSWLRGMMVEIAWSWLLWQPDSALTKWFQRRFGQGTKRQRKIGIVALARKLLIALWRWLEFDEAPAEAELVSWQSKVGLKAA